MTSYVKVLVTSLFCAKTVIIVITGCSKMKIFLVVTVCFLHFVLLIGGKNCFEETKNIKKIILKIWRSNTFLPKFEKLFNIRKL